jgi:hypothetical protein
LVSATGISSRLSTGRTSAAVHSKIIYNQDRIGENTVLQP